MWTSEVGEVQPDAALRALIPGAQFSDAFSISVDERINARQAAERAMARAPRWIDTLIAARNMIMAPFGLKPGIPQGNRSDFIGIFPIVSQTPERVVLGFNDKHLDFRVVVDVFGADKPRRVTLTTVVLTHNLLGRIYLATIKPFHRLVAPTMLRQILR